MAGKNYTTGLIITGDASGAVKATALTEDALRNLNASNRRAARESASAWDRAKESLFGVSSITDLVAKGFAAFSVAAIANEILEVNKQFQSLRASLVTTTGSIEHSKTAFEFIKDFAVNTPFGVEQVTESFITLANLGLRPTEEALRSYGNTAAAQSKPIMQMIEAVADATTGEFERLKEFGIKASAEGDKVSFTFQGTTTTIKNSAADIEKYLIDLGNNKFGDAMERQSNTIEGALSNLGDTWDSFIDNILNDTKENAIGKWVTNAAGWIHWFDVQINGAISNADKLAEINNRIAASKNSLAAHKSNGLIGGLIDDLVGYDANLKKNQIDLATKEREKLLSVMAAEKSAQDVLISSLGKTGQASDAAAKAEKERAEAAKKHAKELESAAKQQATAEKNRRNAVIETIASLQSELEINRLSAKDAVLQTSLRQHLAKAVGAERVQITDLINQIHAENEAREKQKASGEKAKSEMDALIDKYNQLTLSARDYYAAKLQADGLSPEQSKPLLAQFDKNAAFEQTKKQTDDARAAVDDYAKSLEQAAGKMSDMGFVSASVFDGALGGVNAISGAFSNMVKSIQENTDALDALNKNKALNELDKENKNYQKNVVTFAKEEAKLKQANLDASIDGIMQIAGASSQMFEQNSEEAKAMNLVVLGGLAAKAAAAMLTQGTGDPYSAFARIAAMGTLVAGIMSAAGAGGFDFSGGGSTTAPTGSSSTGTVLGDSEAKSASVNNTYELLQDIHAKEYATLRSIDQGIYNLKSGITDVITRLFQAGGINVPTIDGKAKYAVDMQALNLTIGGPLGLMAEFAKKLPVIGGLISGIENFVIGGLFGKTTRSVTGSGIGSNPTSLMDIMNGGDIAGYQYATIETKKKSWFSTKKSYSEQQMVLDEATQDALTRVFKGMGQTMYGLAEQLGHDTKQKVEAYVVPAMKVELHGLSGEDAAKKLNDVISASLDTMSEAVFGEILGQYQQLGEGMLETTTRIVSEIAIVQDALHQSGVSLTGDVIAVSDAIVQAAGGLKEFQGAFEQAFDKFASDGAKQQRLVASLQGQLVELFPQETINTLAKGRDEYIKLAATLDQANPKYAEQYALLIKLAEAADQYYNRNEELRQSLIDLDKTFASFAKNLQSVRGSVGANIVGLGGTASTVGPDWQQRIIDNLYKQLAASSDNAEKVSIISEINSAIMNRYNAELEMLGKVDDAAKRIRDYLDGLKLGDKSPLTNSQKLAESQAQFATQLAMAKAGDKDALAGITGIADAYLQQARTYYASSDTYTGIFSRVTSTLEQLAIPKGMDEATYKKESLKLQDKALSELKSLDNTLLDIYAKEQTATAVRHMELLSALGGANGMDVKAAMADAAMALGRQLTAFETQWIKDQFASGRDKTSIYAEAGQYIKLHGSHASGLDYVPFDGYRAELHRGERVLTAPQARRQDGENDQALIAELRALRAEVAQLRAEQRDHTGALIQSNYDANNRASDKIVKGSKEAAKDSAWANRSKAAII